MSDEDLGPLPKPIRRHDGQPLYGAGQLRDYAAAAVAAERERCARLCETADGFRDQREHGAKLAALIRRA